MKAASFPLRAALVLFSGLTGIYALLAYLPFTYQGVIRFPLAAWIPVFVRFHPLLLLLLVAANAWTDLGRGRAQGRTRALGIAHALWGLAALGTLIFRPLEGIRNDGSSLALALAAWSLPLGLLLVDLRSLAPALPVAFAPRGEARRLLLAALGSALLMVLFFEAFAPQVSGPGLGLLRAWTLSAHLLLALAAAVLLLGLSGLGRLLPRAWMGAAAFAATAGLGLAYYLQREVFVSLAFQGWVAGLVSALLAALALALLLRGALAQPVPADGEAVPDLWFRPLVRLLAGHPGRACAWIAAAAALAWLLLPRAAVFDWNFLFQKALAAGLGSAFFLGLYVALPSRDEGAGWAAALVLLPMVATSAFLRLDETLAARRSSRRPEDRLGPLLERREGADVSVRALRSALAPPRQGVGEIYRLLQRNSNLPRETRTEPVELRHVDTLRPAQGFRPDIYVVVVDSLRRDYLGAYNPKVKFTPELDRFAAESAVVPRAFTRYGATGLSEPSIWTGALMLHKQYVTPFRPLNSLQTLLETDGYRASLSMDSILEVVVGRGEWLRELDPGVGTQDLRLAPSLEKLQKQLEAAAGDPRPVFAYTQCQDLHVSVVNREGGGVVLPGDYAGFHAPYASRLKRLDGALGRFVAWLKGTGRWERSVVILTADHGDSLGEEGRFGHAYTLYPEVVQIPMLIHLPEAYRPLVSMPEAPAFLTDLTPTLYYLLGHRPLRTDPILGRPLFTSTREEQAPFRRERYLLASSYGAVFGLLSGDGRELYISDGIHFKDESFHLDGSPAGIRVPTTPEAKVRYDRLIASEIQALNRFYRFTPPGDAP